MENALQTARRWGNGYSALSWAFVALIFVAPFIRYQKVWDFSRAPKMAVIQIAIIIIMTGWICLHKKGSGVFYPAPFVPIIIFLGYCAAMSVWAINPYASFPVLVHWIVCFLAMIIVSNIVDRDRLLFAILMSALVISVLGIVQHYGFVSDKWPPYGSFSNEKQGAGLVAVALPLAAYFHLKMRPTAFTLYSCVYVAMLWYLCVAGSFTAFIGVYVAMICGAVLFLKSHRQFCVSVLIILVVFGLAFAGPAFRAKEKSFSKRLSFIKGSISMAVDNPLGVGINNFGGQYSLYGVDAGYPNTTTRSTRNVHNDYFQILTEAGWVGAALLILSIVAVLRSFNWEDDTCPFVFAALSAFAVWAVFSFPMYRGIEPFILFSLLGVART